MSSEGKQGGATLQQQDTPKQEPRPAVTMAEQPATPRLSTSYVPALRLWELGIPRCQMNQVGGPGKAFPFTLQLSCSLDSEHSSRGVLSCT